MNATFRTFATGTLIGTLILGSTMLALLAYPAETSAQTTEQECFQRGGTWTPGGLNEFNIEQPGSCAMPGASITASIEKREKKPTTCDSIWSFFMSPIVCTGRTVSAVIGTALITLSAWLLQVTGVLFNWMVYYTIIAFGDSTNGFLTVNVLEKINQVWTVFRDISNILIIGLFIFIALSIILGLKEFGQKKMIARVLIIAVLMNFSLLFTKMIIDASNFVAHQFYTASSVGGGATASATASVTVGSVATEFTQNGIAGQFIKLMGVTSIGDTFTTLRTGADAVNNGFIALLNGFFAATVLLAAAGVFLYGSFLLIVRAVLLVFLLITSSLAFASFLIPKLSTEGAGQKFGWSAWWSSLLRNAVFAPLLLMMLWVALTVAEALVGGRTGSLGALLANPQSAGSIAALFNYIIVLGLLFAAIKISSSFSTSIGGFQIAAAIPALGLAAGARLASFAGRHAIGRPALAASEAMQRASQKEGRGTLSRTLFDFGAQRMKAVAKSDMNVMRTPAGGLLAKTSGLKQDLLAGKKIGGAMGAEEAKAHKIAELARRITPKPEEAKKAATDVIHATIAQNSMLQAEHQQASDSHEHAKADLREAETQHNNTKQEHTAELNNLQTVLTEARRSAAAGTGSDDEVAAAQRNIVEAKNRQATVIGEQTARIREAKHAVDGTRAAMDNVERSALSLAQSQGKLANKISINSDGELQGVRAKTKAETASQLAQDRFTSRFFTEAENERLAHHAYEDVGKQEKKKRVKDLDLKEAIRTIDGDEHTEAPHAPAAGGAPHAPTHTPPTPPPAGGHPPAGGGGGGGGHDPHH